MDMQEVHSVKLAPSCTCGQPQTVDILAVLQQENDELQRRLAEVVETASANEAIWRHFAEIERILFRTREMDQLIEELLKETKSRFQPDQVILLLCHPELLERFYPDLAPDSEPVGEEMWIVPFEMEIGHSICGSAQKPLLFSSENITTLRSILPPTADSVRSGVLIPLCIHQILFGGLFLGSVDANHYHPKDGTDLLEQLGIKVALCMDNCLAYERVKDFAVRDPLTGLHNFFQIHTILEREFRKAVRQEAPLSVLIINLNFFHEMEGHSELANQILKHGAALLREILPEGDSILGRYGSDEFLVILPNVQEEEAQEVVPYLKQTIRKSPYKHLNAAILVQAVIGTATLRDDMRRTQDLLDAAYLDLCSLKMAGLRPSR